MLLMGDYGLWQDRLEEEFLSTPYRPVIFFIDERVLGDIAGNLRDPVGNLGRAVSSYCDLNEPEPFKTIDDLVKRWRRGSRTNPPPVLPIIALSVLAASQMQSTDGVKVSNYYFRLVKLLSPDTFNHKVLVRRIANSENLVRFWRELDAWIRTQEGAVGRSTIRTLETRRKIGYPILQALIRAADRSSLIEFFEGVENLESKLLKEPLFLLFAVWAIQEKKVSNHLLTFIHEPLYREALADVLLELARDWVATGKEPQQKPPTASPVVGSAQLALNLERGSLDLFVRSETTLEAFPLALAFRSWETDVFFERTAPKTQRFRGTLDPAPSLQELSGITLSGRELAWAIPDTRVWVFERRGSHLISRSSIDADSEFWLIPQADAYGEVLQFCEDHFLTYELVHVDAWKRKFFGVENLVFIGGFSNDEVLAEFISTFCPHIRHSITCATSNSSLKLQGGLRVFTDLLRSTYMEGGEPDILLPEEFSGQKKLKMEINGKNRSVYPQGARIMLRDHGLAPGIHTIKIGSTQLSFATISPGSLGAPVKKIGSLKPARQSDQLIFPRERTNYLWFTHDGKTRPVREHRRGRKLVSLGSGMALEAPFFDVVSNPHAVYIAAQVDPLRWELWDLSSPESPSRIFQGVDMAYEWRRSCSNPQGLSEWIELFATGEISHG